MSAPQIRGFVTITPRDNVVTYDAQCRSAAGQKKVYARSSTPARIRAQTIRFSTKKPVRICLPLHSDWLDTQLSKQDFTASLLATHIRASHFFCSEIGDILCTENDTHYDARTSHCFHIARYSSLHCTVRLTSR